MYVLLLCSFAYTPVLFLLWVLSFVSKWPLPINGIHIWLDLSSQTCNALRSRLFHGSISGNRNHFALLRRDLNISYFVFFKFGVVSTLLGLQEWLPELLNWCEILAAVWSGRWGISMELWNSRTPHNSFTDLVTAHWDYAAKKPNMSPLWPPLHPPILLISS